MLSKTSRYSLLTAILLTVMLVVSVVPVATASSNATGKQGKLADGVAIEKMIEKLEPFVTRCDDGTFRLDIPKDAKINKASREFKTVIAGMSCINNLIQDGTLASTANLSLYSVNDGQFALQSNNRNEFKWRWYGFEIWLSHAVCSEIVMAVELGVAASAIAAALGITWPLALAIAGVVSIPGIIISNNDNGCGTHLKFLSGAPPILFYAAPQTCH